MHHVDTVCFSFAFVVLAADKSCLTLRASLVASSISSSNIVLSVTKKTSRLHLVDLAGSERVKHTGASGETLNEASYINKSLAALGDVIKSLATRSLRTDKGKHLRGFVPYRNSPLTYLLKDSLGGNSVTVMIATISPDVDHFDETLSTLNYASRAMRMVNFVTKNCKTETVGLGGGGEVMRLKEEVERLKVEKEDIIRAMIGKEAIGGGVGVGAQVGKVTAVRYFASRSFRFFHFSSSI